jgi:putative ABC transport system permease protein
VVPYLYAVVEGRGESVVLAGTRLESFARLGGFEIEAGRPPAAAALDAAWVGAGVARRFELKPGDSLLVRYRDAFQELHIEGVISTGAAEDNQILAELDTVARLTGGPAAGGAGSGLNTILARAEGNAAAIEQTAAVLGARFPQAAVNPLRQVTQAEFRVVERIRWVLLGTTLVVLVVTGLCVLATMTALAFERRQSIGTMKALGATNRRLALLFLSEAAALALVASAAGFLAGLALARWVGATLFATGVSLRWTTLPLVGAAALAIALVGTLFPLRLVRRVEPAVILRGE